MSAYKRCRTIIFPIKSPPMLIFRYEILLGGDMEMLKKKRSETNATDPPLYYVTIEDTFDIIKSAQCTFCHRPWGA